MTDLRTILTLDNKGTHDAQNLVAVMFRSIALDLGLTYPVWDSLVKKWTKDPHSGVMDDAKKRASEKNNLNRALCEPILAWKMFRRFLMVLVRRNYTFELKLTWDPHLILPKPKPDFISYTPENRANELTQIFRQLLIDVGIDPMLWNIMVERWMDDPRNNVSTNPADRSWLKGNIRKQLFMRNEYTWSGVCRGLHILGVQGFDLDIVLQHSPRKTTRHSFSVITTNEYTLDDIVQ